MNILNSASKFAARSPIEDEVRTALATDASVTSCGGRRLKQALRARTLRNAYFNPRLFSDPAWDMLLVLYEARLSQRRMSVSKVGPKSRIPATTALRWISTLEHEGLIERENDRFDGRRVFLHLSPKGVEAMEGYFRNIPAGVPLF